MSFAGVRSALIGNVRQENGTTVVELSGRIDATTAPDVKAQLVDMVASGQSRLVLNLKDVEFIDSTGLGVLVSCLRRCVASGGALCLAELPEFARAIFDLTRVTRVFRIEESEAEAVRALEADGGQ